MTDIINFQRRKIERILNEQQERAETFRIVLRNRNASDVAIRYFDGKIAAFEEIRGKYLKENGDYPLYH